ncbi:MAG TPA: DUF3099 domain-containing protein, partial [Pseudonocardia sp.]|nr:DUF3099 domain-containing protein [Pseudonocardia sp.]
MSVPTRRRPDPSLLITDAAPSFDEEQGHRRRVYLALMIVHLVGFGLSYPLYLWQPWAGALMVLLTGGLPWVAVVLANGPRRSAGSPRRPVRDALPGPDGDTGR